MTHAPVHPGQPNYGYTPAPPAPTNALAIIGFVCSLVGLVSCGLISPIGLLLSFIAIFREPRGFAIAGVILGAIGSMWMLVAVVLVGGAVLVGLIAAVVSGAGIAGVIEAFTDGQKISEAVGEYAAANGVLPVSLADLPGLDPDVLVDHWGRPYVYEVAPDGSWKLVSHGADGAPGGGDDITVEY